MTDPDTSRHIEIKDGDQTVAAAEVTTSQDAGGTVQASLHAASGHIAPGSRASLVDAVMDLPEVQASTRMEATVPLGDGETLERLRERTEDAVTRSAGSTTLLDANIPSGGRPGPHQDHLGVPALIFCAISASWLYWAIRTKINCNGLGYQRRRPPNQRMHPPCRTRSAQQRASWRRAEGAHCR